MFTGLITAQGELIEREDLGDRRLRIQTPWSADQLELGASIACSGCCLTVTQAGPGEGAGHWFDCEVSAESLQKTTLSEWQVGQIVNLEPALKMGDPLGGHQVLGHVDGEGTVITIEPVGDSHRVVFEAPAELAPLIAQKGSIAIDGVSLTVNDVAATRFEVNIIPHTWQVTAFNELRVGQAVNLEIDPLARYLDRYLSSVDLPALLARHGAA